MKLPPMPAVFTPETYLAWLRHQSGRFEGMYRATWRNAPCVYCGEFPANKAVRDLHLTRDHIRPASEGGGDDWTNMATACDRCNHRRGVMPVLWYLVMRQLLVYVPLSKKERHLMGFRACPLPTPERCDMTVQTHASPPCHP